MQSAQQHQRDNRHDDMKSKSDLELDAYFASLSPEEVEEIRRKVQQGIASIEAGRYTECKGRRDLKKLVSDIKTRGRARLSKNDQ